MTSLFPAVTLLAALLAGQTETSSVPATTAADPAEPSFAKTSSESAPALVLDPAASRPEVETHKSAPLVIAPTPVDGYLPLMRWEPDEMLIEVPISMGIRGEDVGRYPLDANLRARDSALSHQLRMGARFDSKLALVPILLAAELEADLITGTSAGLNRVKGEGLPNQDELTQELRKASGRVSLGPYLHLGGGFMTSHFGLGLVANDGTSGWAPKNARFLDPRGGDRVVRGFLATGPLTTLKIFGSLAVDSVIDDDVLLSGDEATQLSAAVIVGRKEPNSAGLYVVYRMQDAKDGNQIRALAVDLFGTAQVPISTFATLVLEAELAFITGSTTLARTADFEERDIQQVGMALRGRLDAETFGLVFDFLYASGDSSLDDGTQTAFKADPNYGLGLLLFSHVLASHTGRAPITTRALDLVGVPPEDVERFPTRGSVSNTIAFFPRLFLRPVPELELYGGPLFAFSAASVVDPFLTRLAGGDPRNVFGGEPGEYLGTELDLGLRSRLFVVDTSELVLGLEGGVFWPGDAFDGPNGRGLGLIRGGRLLIQYRM